MPDPIEPWQHLVQVLTTIGLTILLGMEREEHATATSRYTLAGVRTFPLIGLLGYSLSLLSPHSALPTAVGFAGLSALLVVSYSHKLRDGNHGVTTEITVLTAYMVGALVARDLMWVAASATVAAMLLLQAKAPLRDFVNRVGPAEINTFVRFLLLSAIILPLLPDQKYTQFDLNPYRTWLIVVAVSGISYVSYVVQRVVRSRHSLVLAAVLGGAYSSTVTTVVLAKQSRAHADDGRSDAYVGATVLASAMMYLRLAVLLWIFNYDLGWLLGPRFIVLGVVAGLAGWAVMLLPRTETADHTRAPAQEARNPLEVGTAFLFAALFLGLSVVTQLVTRSLGAGWLYVLSAVMGATDVDPFIMGLTQTAGSATPVAIAAVAIIIATASNNVMKGVYARSFGGGRTGTRSLVALVALSVVSLLSLIGL